MAETRHENIVAVSNLQKNYGSVPAVKGISFEMKEGESYTLLGPSGCGKTTTLRCLAGLERIHSGEIAIGGRPVDDGKRFVPPYQRPIGMVFQSYAIWPHMTVAQNVAFPLRNQKKKVTGAEVRSKVLEALRLVQLDGLEDRPAPNLSGGQQQRLALARALVCAPSVLLLDEPLSNLDAKLREEMRGELKSLTKRLGITTLYVTHDQLEALVLSDRIALMRDGVIVEEGTQYDLYMYPKHIFTAGFFGTNNILEARVDRVDTAKSSALLNVGLGGPLIARIRDLVPEPGRVIQVAIRPENIRVKRNSVPIDSDGRDETVNVFRGTMTEAVFLGDFIDYRVRLKDTVIRVRANPQELLTENCSVNLSFHADDVCLLV